MATTDPTLAPIFANVGVEVAYRNALLKMLRELQLDCLLGLTPEYSNLAMDDGIFEGIKSAFKKTTNLWLKRLDDLAPKLARAFATNSQDYIDKTMFSLMRKAGFVIEFKKTEQQQAALDAVIESNVALIRSIASKHLGDVEAMVWQSIQEGHNLADLTNKLQKRYDISRKRAVLIATDQNNKAKAAMEQARRIELGITEAIWLHSRARKHPRIDHLEANGKKFDIRKGMYLEGEWVLPGQKINCGCTSRAVIPFLQVKK